MSQNHATEAERALFKAWLRSEGRIHESALGHGDVYVDADSAEIPWRAWQAARAIPLAAADMSIPGAKIDTSGARVDAVNMAAAEPVAYLAEDDEGNVGLGRTERHAMRACDPGATVTPLFRGKVAAPDRAPSIAGFNVILDESLPVDTMEMRGANTVRCENVSAPSTDSATERDARLLTQGMADCMDMVRSELIEAGVIDKSVAPMFIANAVCARLAESERDAARYRFLRDNGVGGEDGYADDALLVYKGFGESSLLPDELDNALDRAIAAMKGEG